MIQLLFIAYIHYVALHIASMHCIQHYIHPTTVEVWGPWFLYALFFAILVWEECWHLNNTAALSSWLLLLITGGAVVCSAVRGVNKMYNNSQ